MAGLGKGTQMVILGITLSILHQSGLGALFLMAKPKIHPLWWSEFIPILFFVSSIYAGLAMIIFEGTISHKVFSRLIPTSHHHAFDDIIFGLAKGAAITMFVYYFFKALIFVHGQQWEMLSDGWGLWYLVEVIGFVFIPGIMFAFGFKHRNLRIIKIAAAMALLGIILNRLNIAFITYAWYSDVHYWPTWQEIVVTLMVIFAELWVLRWVVTRLPVFTSAHKH
jgi:Ni/Fe-hydrogenase subunit HybB-like protein